MSRRKEVWVVRDERRRKREHRQSRREADRWFMSGGRWRALLISRPLSIESDDDASVLKESEVVDGAED